MTQEEIIADIKDFLKAEVINNPNVEIGADEKIITNGLIDSMGIVRLILYLEKVYCIKEIEKNDMILDNFQTINCISNMILHYLNVQG